MNSVLRLLSDAMIKKTKLLKSRIVVNLPRSVELSRRETENALEVEVEVGGVRKGKLYLAQGSVTWKPAGNSRNVHRMWWGDFVELAQKMPRRQNKA